MKGNKKILVIAILLLLIAVSYGTYAIYKSAFSGTATVSTAVWHIEFSDGSEILENNFNVVFEGTDCHNNHVLDGKIAPGATCEKTITLDADGTEVDVEYTVSVDDSTITVTPSTSTDDANDFTASLSPSTGRILYSANDQTATLTLSITWAGTDDSDTDTINAADTALAGKTLSVPVTLIAKQVPVTAS